MPKIVILGSCRFEPYIILFTPAKIPKLWNTEEGYKEASKICYPSIDDCDEVWVYAPDGIGEHTGRDIEYAKSKGKTIRFLKEDLCREKTGLIEKMDQNYSRGLRIVRDDRDAYRERLNRIREILLEMDEWDELNPFPCLPINEQVLSRYFEAFREFALGILNRLREETEP